MRQILIAGALLLVTAGAVSALPQAAAPGVDQIVGSDLLKTKVSPNFSLGEVLVSLCEISKEQEQTNKELTDTDIVLNRRIMELEKKQAEWEKFWASYSKETAIQDQETHRVLTGVQGQITVLHSKKADKEALQETRDQVANCLRMMRKAK